MPFINITFQEAKNCLKDRDIIVELLKNRKINPKEADLMNHLHLYAQGDQVDSINKVKDLCMQYFPSNHEDSENNFISLYNLSHKEATRKFEYKYFENLMFRNDGKIMEAAKQAKITNEWFGKKIKQLGLKT